MASPQEIAAARAHIEAMRRTKFSIGAQQRSQETEELLLAAESIQDDARLQIGFFKELIQNADDNNYPPGVYPSLEFVITPRDITDTGVQKTLIVFNNEVGFSKQDIESICSIGDSKKKGRRHAGLIKGIGFKTVFSVTKEPYIFSNGYQIKFSDAPCGDCRIPLIVPQWVEEKPKISDILRVYGVNKVLPKTVIILPLKSVETETVEKALLRVDAEHLLFLSKIKQLSVHVRKSDDSAEEEPSATTINTYISPLVEGDISATTIGKEIFPSILGSSDAHSWIVHLSAVYGSHVLEGFYFVWRQRFLVSDARQWAATLALPCGKRLGGAAPSGLFVSLPTAIFTGLPFIIQSDFIPGPLEVDYFDWNSRMLRYVPSAFVHAFWACLYLPKPLNPAARAFESLPSLATNLEDSWACIANSIATSIRKNVTDCAQLPCEQYYKGQVSYARPTDLRRVIPSFRGLLYRAKLEQVSLRGIESVKKLVLHSVLDTNQFDGILGRRGVEDAYSDPEWYGRCMQNRNLAARVSSDLYIDLLCFLESSWDLFCTGIVLHIPLLRYVVGEEMRLCSVRDAKVHGIKILYSVNLFEHDWLTMWQERFNCPSKLFLLPSPTQEALMKHSRKSGICAWLKREVCISPTTVPSYCELLVKFLRENILHTVAVTTLPRFLKESLHMKLISEPEVRDICRLMPIVDGSGMVQVERTGTLLPARDSKWFKLFGINPYAGLKYIELGTAYEGHVGHENIMEFLSKYCNAVDLPELCPLDLALSVASTHLTADRAFLLLEWLHCLRLKGDGLPLSFIESIQDGKWMKTVAGFSSPNQTDLSAVDESYYLNNIRSYKDELKLIGVKNVELIK